MQPSDPLEVNLGSFGRIEQSSKICPLCSTIAKIIRQKTGSTSANVAKFRGDDVNFTTSADQCYYGHITDSLMDGDTSWNDSYFVVRRLDLRVKAQNDKWDRAFLYHFVQPCNVYLAAGSMLAGSSNTMKESGEMIFGGRKRPLILDIRLLQHWRNLCVDGHHLSCGAEDEAYDKT